MKQFNLEEYLANPSKKVITRDGRKARIVCTNAKGAYPVIALLTVKAGYEEVELCYVYDDKGELGRIDTNLDLFFAPEKKEGWINIYENNWLDSTIYPSKEDALNMIGGDMKYITTIKIELEE